MARALRYNFLGFRGQRLLLRLPRAQGREPAAGAVQPAVARALWRRAAARADYRPHQGVRCPSSAQAHPPLRITTRLPAVPRQGACLLRRTSRSQSKLTPGARLRGVQAWRPPPTWPGTTWAPRSARRSYSPTWRARLERPRPSSSWRASGPSPAAAALVIHHLFSFDRTRKTLNSGGKITETLKP